MRRSKLAAAKTSMGSAISIGITGHVLKLFASTTTAILSLDHRTICSRKDGVQRRRERSEAEDSREREAVFQILHSPPSEFGCNRTTWKTTDLQQALMATQVPLTTRRIRSIIKDAGYRWRKAKKVLTSSDPEYRAKLDAVQSILLNLNRDEGFFSIDEFGPLAITKKGGRKLVRPNDEPTIPQWQRSKGTLIVTAALELSTNQVTHFYSERKNTDEVIKLLDLLLERHADLCRLYLSWDAASWHMSKRLTERIRSNNVMALVTGSTRVEVAPLPARAQFLNVINPFSVAWHGR